MSPKQIQAAMLSSSRPATPLSRPVGRARHACGSDRPLAPSCRCCHNHSSRTSNSKTSAPCENSENSISPGLTTASVLAPFFLPGSFISSSAAARVAETLEESMAAEGIVPVDPANYVPQPIEVGWQIYFGAAVGAFPFFLGAYEFTKRIMIQRRCEVCSGSGLVTVQDEREVKCPQCGGFFPWRSWGEFFSANARPGNGGVLRFPKGQTSVFYTVPEQRSSKTSAVGGQESDAVSAAATREADVPDGVASPRSAGKEE